MLQDIYIEEAEEILQDCKLNTDFVTIEDFARDLQMLDSLELSEY